jgi:hypothetical protein
MKRIIEVSTSAGTVPIEVDDMEDVGDLAVPGTRQISGALSENFEVAVEKVKPAVMAIFETLRKVSVPADQIEVEFGIKIGIKAGVYIAGADTEGTFRIKMSWKKTKE